MASTTTSAAAAAGQKLSVEQLQALGQKLLAATAMRPKIGIVCGSGLGGLANSVRDCVKVPYETMGVLPKSTVQGHEGNFVFGKLNGIEVILLQGRIHPYEGHSTYTCSLPVQILKMTGVETLLLTNAAGGLNQAYNVGDFMIIKDHVSLPGMSGLGPLVGPNDERLGARFVPLSDAYDRELRSLAKRVASEVGEQDCVREGVYAHYSGPEFETVAESKFLVMMGCDAVGMSTAYEVAAARHLGMRVFAVSLISDMVIMDYDTPEKTDHLAVLETGKRRAGAMEKFITAMISKIN